MKLDVRVDSTAITLQLERVRKDIQDRIIPRALNRTATTVRAEAARKTAAELRVYGVRIGVNVARKFMKILRASRANQVATVAVGGKLWIPLIKLGRRVAMPSHAFVQTMKSGHKGIYIRAGSSKPVRVDLAQQQYRSKRIKRSGSDLPIGEVVVPGVKQAFIQEKIRDALIRIAKDRFAAVVTQELKRG